MIRHENELTNQRITWLLTIQGFMFAALCITWGKPGFATLVYPICIIGFSIPLSAYFALRSSSEAIDSIWTWWLNFEGKSLDGPGIMYRDAQLEDIILKNQAGTGAQNLEIRKKNIAYLLPWNFYPRLFMVIWLFIPIFYNIQTTTLNNEEAQATHVTIIVQPADQQGSDDIPE